MMMTLTKLVSKHLKILLSNQAKKLKNQKTVAINLTMMKTLKTTLIGNLRILINQAKEVENQTPVVINLMMMLTMIILKKQEKDVKNQQVLVTNL